MNMDILSPSEAEILALKMEILGPAEAEILADSRYRLTTHWQSRQCAATPPI